jgi:hypothetical protein
MVLMERLGGIRMEFHIEMADQLSLEKMGMRLGLKTGSLIERTDPR